MEWLSKICFFVVLVFAVCHHFEKWFEPNQLVGIGTSYTQNNWERTFGLSWLLSLALLTKIDSRQILAFLVMFIASSGSAAYWQISYVRILLLRGFWPHWDFRFSLDGKALACSLISGDPILIRPFTDIIYRPFGRVYKGNFLFLGKIIPCVKSNFGTNGSSSRLRFIAPRRQTGKNPAHKGPEILPACQISCAPWQVKYSWHCDRLSFSCLMRIGKAPKISNFFPLGNFHAVFLCVPRQNFSRSIVLRFGRYELFLPFDKTYRSDNAIDASYRHLVD